MEHPSAGLGRVSAAETGDKALGTPHLSAVHIVTPRVK